MARGGKVRLAPGREVRKREGGEGRILQYRNGRVPLNDSAAAILELCDGTRTRDGIVARIVRSQDDKLAADVREFLDAARRCGWIVEL